MVSLIAAVVCNTFDDVNLLSMNYFAQDEALRTAACLCLDRLRLANGGSPCAGRVEVYHDEKWGTVDDRSWDKLDAAVVCKELDCGTALSATVLAHFGAGSGPIVTYNVKCRGNESALRDCESMPWGDYSQSGFYHAYEAGVICSGKDWHLRLENGGSRCDGRVEIYHDGTWGRLLDDSWNISDAAVICRQQNCGSVISIYNSSQYGEGTGPVWINNVQCTGTETHIWKCPHSTVASPSRSSRDVGVLCSEDISIRLMDGGSSCAGRVEIYYKGTWGTVCDDSWGSLEAEVACKQLGCGSAVNTTAAAPCGRASGQVWLDEVRCTGNESALWECATSPWGQHDCHHKEDVSIVCTGHRMLRLVNGQHSCEGRVEVFYNETWGTVCSDVMGMELMGLEAAELISIPFVACIVLGILLALVLFALIAQMDSNSSERGSNDSTREPEYYTGECANGSDLEQGNSEVFLSNDDGHLQEDDDDAESGTFQVPERGLLLLTDTHPDFPALTSHNVQEISLCPEDGHHTDSDPLFAVDTSQCGYDYLDVDCDNDTEQERQLPIGNQRESPELCTV
eukprot:gi/632983377/ref/XP_007908617.1/ PREDICTED: scavenger receptor cysteine-rich type 1 protein M160-like [Callorhinchus milii]